MYNINDDLMRSIGIEFEAYFKAHELVWRVENWPIYS